MKENAPRLLSRGFSICIGLFVILTHSVTNVILADPIDKGGAKTKSTEAAAANSGDSLTEKIRESKAQPVSPGEGAASRRIELQAPTWTGKIQKNEARELGLDLLFSYEGRFFIEATAWAFDKELKVWKTLGLYYLYVTIREGEAGNVERTRTRPKVPPQTMKSDPPTTANWYELAARASLNDTIVEQSPVAIHSHQRPWPLHQSIQAGEPPLNLTVGFQANPKINQRCKLVLTMLSQAARDSVTVSIILPDSVKICK